MNNRIRFLIGLAVLFAIGLTALASHPGSVTLRGRFTATVRLGPDRGWFLAGDLRLEVNRDGTASGRLTRMGKATVNVSGTIKAQAVHLAFEVDGAKYVFGTGVLDRPVDASPKAMGGTLAGPREGDIGDWGYGIGGRQ